MTKQITIKLNEKSFKPVLDRMMKATRGVARSNSELVGMCVFYVHEVNFRKAEQLGNKTRAEFLLEKFGYTGEDGLLEWLKDFKTFMKKRGFD